MVNYLSIDLESWASPNLPEFISLSSKKKKQLDNGNIKKSALEALNILRKYKVKITFFIVGQLYEWYPEVVEAIASAKHEIAYHTHEHDALNCKNDLIKSIQKSKKFLQRFKPTGFRAPRIAFNENHLKTLKTYGFKYDSSIYGTYAERKKINGILEIPVTSISKVPIGSGYFIGALGRNIKWPYKRINEKGNPVVSFIHNWQIVRPENPSFPTTKYLLSHPYYLPYLVNCRSSFEHLIQNFKWAPMKNLLK